MHNTWVIGGKLSCKQGSPNIQVRGWLQREKKSMIINKAPLQRLKPWACLRMRLDQEHRETPCLLVQATAATYEKSSCVMQVHRMFCQKFSLSSQVQRIC